MSYRNPLKKQQIKVARLIEQKHNLDLETNKKRTELDSISQEPIQISKAITDMNKRLLSEKESLERLKIEYEENTKSYRKEVENLILQKEELEMKINCCKEILIEDQKEKKRLENLHDSLHIEIASLIEDKDKLFNDFKSLEKNYTELKQEFNSKTTFLDKATQEAIKNLESLNKAIRIQQEYIKEEEKRIAAKRADIDIYERRLKKKYPKEEFVFTS